MRRVQITGGFLQFTVYSIPPPRTGVFERIRTDGTFKNFPEKDSAQMAFDSYFVQNPHISNFNRSLSGHIIRHNPLSTHPRKNKEPTLIFRRLRRAFGIKTLKVPIHESNFIYYYRWSLLKFITMSCLKY